LKLDELLLGVLSLGVLCNARIELV
jgi:hypothetical protein